eukprot:365159-Chlamydomonas_euryale.AAC.19
MASSARWHAVGSSCRGDLRGISPCTWQVERQLLLLLSHLAWQIATVPCKLGPCMAPCLGSECGLSLSRAWSWLSCGVHVRVFWMLLSELGWVHCVASQLGRHKWMKGHGNPVCPHADGALYMKMHTLCVHACMHTKRDNTCSDACQLHAWSHRHGPRACMEAASRNVHAEPSACAPSCCPLPAPVPALLVARQKAFPYSSLV